MRIKNLRGVSEVRFKKLDEGKVSVEKIWAVKLFSAKLLVEYISSLELLENLRFLTSEHEKVAFLVWKTK